VTFLVIGTFLDPLPAILIFTPIFLPIAQQIGMGKVHFTITMVFGLCYRFDHAACGVLPVCGSSDKRAAG
jgi:TRAP-type mannitol/chloroaromatic compound transport system permease large subunit